MGLGEEEGTATTGHQQGPEQSLGWGGQGPGVTHRLIYKLNDLKCRG